MRNVLRWTRDSGAAGGGVDGTVAGFDFEETNVRGDVIVSDCNK